MTPVTPTPTPHEYAYGFPASNRSDGFNVSDIINLFEKLAVQLNEEFRIEVYNSATKDLMGIFPISPIEVSQ